MEMSHVALWFRRHGQHLCIGMVLLVSWVVLAWPFLRADGVPAGNELPVHMTRFTAWRNARSCGLCMLWDHTGGGAPFFGDPYTAAQHPVVAVYGLVTDPLTAANLTIATALLMLGIAGWWYAHTCGYGTVTTIWLVELLLYGGHALGRLDIGTVALPLAVASFALVVVAVLRWFELPTGGRLRTLVLMAAGLVLAGQGYLQLLALCWSLPVLVYAVRRHGWRVVAPALGRGGAGVAVLCAPLLVGYLTQRGYMVKTTDEALPTVQALGYVLLHLVVAAPVLPSDAPGVEQVFPYLFHNYIGAGSVGYAVVGLGWLLRPMHHDPRNAAAGVKTDRTAAVLWVSLVVVVVVVVSGLLPQALLALAWSPVTTMVLGWRNLVLVSAALPIAVACLSAAGVERLWLIGRARVAVGTAPGWLSAVVAVLALLLVGTLGSVVTEGLALVRTGPLPSEAQALVGALDGLPVGYVETEDDMQYLAVLLGDAKNFWTLFYPYHLNDEYPLVPARYRITMQDTAMDAPWEYVDSRGGLSLYQRTDPSAAYAVIGNEPDMYSTDGTCQTTARGGDITLRCDIPAAAPLTVREYALPGWQATVDGVPAPLRNGTFLTVDTPAGTHTVAFRYRPWLVMLALAMSMVGWVGCFSMFVRELLAGKRQ